MAEYIERNAAIAALNEVRDDQRVFKYATASDFLSARDAIERAIKVLESLPAADVEPVQERISVNDRLPDDEQEVLVIAHGWDGRLVYVGSHKRVEAQKSWLTGITNKSSEWSLWGWSYLKEPMVTHWMPLPSTEGLK